ncbi:Tetratricopeptide repeat protein [Ooceraea biroi]|uniref:Tetratricopeptide repeat protein n=1 Tax=Ooceraea biroi TaxID=2015173 RepID=A0A026WKX9_OOCBI|nr:Tetratricopeptide repeat protein [Ooceraea biroi]
MDKISEERTWTEAERLELAAKLDAELDEYISNLEKKSYTEGWPEDKWQEEMEKHPFFMKKAPEPDEELSPLMEGLQQLKYGEDENTPEELANNYKEDGNFNYKYKKYRLAILSYTEGIKTKCKDDNLMAQLYNNRAAAHFMLQNYRSSLNDCKLTLKLNPQYWKALNRAATCSYHIKNYDQCIDLCDQFLNHSPTDKAILKLKSGAAAARERFLRDKRKQEKLERKLDNEKEKLLEAIWQRGINLETTDGKRNLELKDLEPQAPQIAQCRVHFDEKDKLVWPVIILYPESQQTDFIQNFHEDASLIEHLAKLFEEPPEWDVKHHYTVENINVYFEGKNKCSVHKVDVQLTLNKILQNKQTVEGNSRKTANRHYGAYYANSYACSNGAPSVYTSNVGCCTTINGGGGFNAQQPQLHEDYRPIYFYVAQPYTIPYAFAKRPKPAAAPSSLLRTAKSRGNHCCAKFPKRLSNVDFSQKVKQGEFSRSLNQVHFAERQGQVFANFPRAGASSRDPRMTSMFRRGTIFATFFLSLLGGGLVCAALVTQHWVEARPWRTPNPQESAGRVHFGLLQGKKELNVAYGWRTYHVSVPQMIRQDPSVMSWALWIGTLTTTAAALLAAALAALLAVLNTATSPRSKILSIPGVYFINILTLLMCLASTCTWLAQYYTRLYANVLPKEDIDNMWTSEGSAELGYSFWLVVSAGVVHLISIALVGWGSGKKKDDCLEPIPALEEKTAAAIMLY